MYLKSIVIQGFKSFFNTTKIELDDNITGVVGPNGSGKSNVVDAVRWVLGEQSVKSLRGTDKMSDIIFSGTEKRDQSNKASVALILDNSDGFFKLDYSEIEIKRRLYRDGTNEYYLNSEKCRLKDITDLLLDTGLSKEAFNIISQGKVEEVLSSKPEERRLIFEEAAEVLKYKKRKVAALSKLERTHDNLDRVNDIVNEIEPRIEPLKIESEKAIKYVETKKELEEIEIALITEDINTYNHEYISNKEGIEELQSDVIKASSTYETNDAKTEQIRLKINELDDTVNNKQTELVNSTKKLEQLNSKKMLATERNKYDASDTKINNEIIKLKEETAKEGSNISNLELDIDMKRKEINNIVHNSNEAEINYNKTKVELDNQTYKLSKLSQKETDLKYQISTLTNSIENNAGLYKGVKAVLNNTRLSGIMNVIGKIINTKEYFAEAIEVSLGGASQFIVCENENSATKAINFLKENHLGKATFFPINVIKSRHVDNSTLELLNGNNDFIGVAATLTDYAKEYKSIIYNQLGNVLVVKNIEAGTKISKLIHHRYKIVTLDGELIHVGGSMTGGKTKYSGSGMIKEKYELETMLRNQDKIIKEKKDIEQKLNDTVKKLKVEEEIKYSITTKRIGAEEKLKVKQELLNTTKEKYKGKLDELESLSSLEHGSDKSKELTIIDEYYEQEQTVHRIEKELKEIKDEKHNLSIKLDELEADIRKTNTEYNKKQNELKTLEISQGKIEVKLDNLLLTLTEEYNITFEKAKNKYKLELDANIARNKVNLYKKDIRDLGIVNIAAIEEYERVNKRYEFLSKQKEDLYKAEEMLLEVIKEMDVIMKDKFIKTFNQIEVEFKKTFTKLFNGGHADLVLTDPDNILETGIDITCQPPGKNLKHISLLSGGEKSLTAISLLFSIIAVKTVPFCILDEVEAALDDVNVKRFGDYLTDLAKKTQFIVITHKKKTMEYVDVLYGVTMQESGISKLVSVKLEDIKK